MSPRPSHSPAAQRCRSNRPACRLLSASSPHWRESPAGAARNALHSLCSTPSQPPHPYGTSLPLNREHPLQSDQKIPENTPPDGRSLHSSPPHCGLPSAPHSGTGFWLWPDESRCLRGILFPAAWKQSGSSFPPEPRRDPAPSLPAADPKS